MKKKCLSIELQSKLKPKAYFAIEDLETMLYWGRGGWGPLNKCTEWSREGTALAVARKVAAAETKKGRWTRLGIVQTV